MTLFDGKHYPSGFLYFPARNLQPGRQYTLRLEDGDLLYISSDSANPKKVGGKSLRAKRSNLGKRDCFVLRETRTPRNDKKKASHTPLRV